MTDIKELMLSAYLKLYCLSQKYIYVCSLFPTNANNDVDQSLLWTDLYCDNYTQVYLHKFVQLLQLSCFFVLISGWISPSSIKHLSEATGYFWLIQKHFLGRSLSLFFLLYGFITALLKMWDSSHITFRKLSF